MRNVLASGSDLEHTFSAEAGWPRSWKCRVLTTYCGISIALPRRGPGSLFTPCANRTPPGLLHNPLNYAAFPPKSGASRLVSGLSARGDLDCCREVHGVCIAADTEGGDLHSKIAVRPSDIAGMNAGYVTFGGGTRLARRS